MALDLDVAVKIGGAEANSDIVRCLRRGITDIVAPLVETTYAAHKFTQAAHSRALSLGINEIGLHVNLETKTAAKNSIEIIENHKKLLKGIVVGRSDLSMSMGLSKKEVDSDKVMNVVSEVLKTGKAAGLMTTMGGTISTDSVSHISNLYSSGMLNRFETRAVVFNIKTNDKSLLSDSVRCALRYEQLLLKARSIYHSVRSTELKNRIESIEGRKNAK